MNPKKDNFQEKYSDLCSWVNDVLAHSLAKKLTKSEIESLLSEFRRVRDQSLQKRDTK